jgi:hypothetical protein
MTVGVRYRGPFQQVRYAPPVPRIANSIFKTHLRVPAACFARGLHRSFRPLLQEGAGNAGRPMRPQAACAEIGVESTRVGQVTPESSGIPRAMVYGLLRALPGDRAFLPPSPAKTASRELDASVGASGPHGFAVRKSARPRLWRRPASIASRPASVTISSRPSVGQDGQAYRVIRHFGKPEYFYERGWTGVSQSDPTGKSLGPQHARRCLPDISRRWPHGSRRRDAPPHHEGSL